MKTNFVYQLNCNLSHDRFYAINILNNHAAMDVYKEYHGNLCVEYTLPLSFYPVSGGWIENYILLVGDLELLSIDSDTYEVRIYSVPSYKPIDFLTFSKEGNYIYSTIIDPDYIDFYWKDNNGKEDKIATYSISQHSLSLNINCKKKAFLQGKIKDYLGEYRRAIEKNVYDDFEGNELIIKHLPYTTEVYLCNRLVCEEFGYIDRAVICGGQVVYTISNLLVPAELKILNVSDTITTTKEWKNKFGLTLVHKKHENLYYYVLHRSAVPKGIFVMLHGGPASRYSNKFDKVVWQLLESGYDIYLVNYPGSAGYGRDYQELLFARAGTVDADSVMSFVRFLYMKNNDVPIYLLGDSYGAYLAIVTYLKLDKEIKHVFALNAFTDIRHQFLFSKSREMLIRYFDFSDLKKIKEVNPIDLAKVTRKKCKNLTIINGTEDFYCPKEQVIQFERMTKCRVVFLPNHKHYTFDDSIVSSVVDKILSISGGKQKIRYIDPSLQLRLFELKKTADSQIWERFYEFIIQSYYTKKDSRFSISDLFFEIKKLDIAEPGEMIKAYAHGMYLLAKYNNKKIYGEYFNV